MEKRVPVSLRPPADHTRSLVIYCPEAVTTADEEEGGWVPIFSRVVCLEGVLPTLSRSRSCARQGG